MNMQNYLETKQKLMINTLENLVNIDSGSYLKSGVDQIGEFLLTEYKALGFMATVYEQEDFGNHIVFHHQDAKDPAILIMAHMDTVYPEGTVKERPFHINGNRAYGPGIIDMKSSLVSVLFAIKALKESGDISYQNVVLLLNSDEEVGSPTSRSLIEEIAADKKFALVMEPARKDGSLVSSRRGKGNFTLHVRGRAAHSGIEPEKGRSAIEELAYKVIQFQDLNDHEKGISVNVGLIEGGSSINTVSEHATAQIDIRISDKEQAQEIEEKIEEICSVTTVPGTEVELEGEMNRPPMEKNKQTVQLLKFIKDAGKEIGLEITDTATGGGSDASFTAAVGVATVDGLGPIGGNSHSEKEYLEIDSLTERTLLLAMIIKKLSE